MTEKRSAERPDVSTARREAEIRRINRREQLGTIDDYVSFFTAKALGASGLAIGGLELLAPDVLPIALSQPSWVAAIGLALLTGKNIIKLISAADDILGGKK